MTALMTISKENIEVQAYGHQSGHAYYTVYSRNKGIVVHTMYLTSERKQILNTVFLHLEHIK